MMGSTLLDQAEAARIAGELAAKYGADALDHARARAECAQSVGDELAFGAWQSVLDATERLLGRRSRAAPPR
jgi:hypothetical protein